MQRVACCGRVFSAETPDYMEHEQKQQSPDKGVKERQKDLKRLWEPFAVRVNQQAGINDRKSEHKRHDFTYCFYHAGISACIEKESLHHEKCRKCMNWRKQNQEDDFFDHFQLCPYYLRISISIISSKRQ
jgi:hypothetical protein